MCETCSLLLVVNVIIHNKLVWVLIWGHYFYAYYQL